MKTSELVGTVIGGICMVAGLYIAGYAHGNYAGWKEGYEDGRQLGEIEGWLRRVIEERKEKHSKETCE